MLTFGWSLTPEQGALARLDQLKRRCQKFSESSLYMDEKKFGHPVRLYKCAWKPDLSGEFPQNGTSTCLLQSIRACHQIRYQSFSPYRPAAPGRSELGRIFGTFCRALLSAKRRPLSGRDRQILRRSRSAFQTYGYCCKV